MTFSPSSHARLTARDLARFPGPTLFERLARACCVAECLPRKELYEAWEVARRARRLFRGGRVIDLGGGHGLLAHAMLLLDQSSPGALVVDRKLPLSCARLHTSLSQAWPRLDRVAFIECGLEEVDILPGDVVVSSHACGNLTDVVLDRALKAGAQVAVLPCCHNLSSADASTLSGWVDGALAIDIARAQRLRQRGYSVRTQAISAAITPKNRLLLGIPPCAAPPCRPEKPFQSSVRERGRWPSIEADDPLR
jgi:hypothetical protein